MFDTLGEKFSKIIKKIKGEHKLTESNIDSILKDIRIALLEADVNYKVVKDFLAKIKEKCLGEEVINELNPSEMVVKIVKDELIELLGSDKTEITYQKNGPTTIMLVGLQGSGKTTTASKLAYLMKNKLNKKVLLVACDVYRLAAIDQLKELGKSIDVEVYSLGIEANPVDIASKAYEKARKENFDVVIIDTAGRLSIDEALMEELKNIKANVEINETLLVVDAMSGQEACNVANAFNEKVPLTGFIMTKFDGDTRGGAALSIRSLTNVPIKFIGVGEKVSDLDIFYPERMADRILGMGDILTFVDKVTENIDEKEAKKAANKMLEGRFTLDDMLDQMKQIKKLGSMQGLLKLIPGMPKITDEQQELMEKEMKNFEVICQSMTPEERANPAILKNSRKVRIAKGCGKTNADINKLLKKYEQMNMMAKQLKNNKGKFGGFNGNFPGGNFPKF